MHNLKMVLAPQWVIRALDASQAPKKILRDPNKLSGILSEADVEFYMYINNELHSRLPSYLSGTFDNVFQDEGVLCLEALVRFNAEYDGIESASFLLDRHRLSYTVGEPGEVDLKFYPHNVTRIDERCFMLTIGERNPDVNDFDHAKDSLSVVDMTIREVLSYISFEEIVLTPLFKEYMRLSNRVYIPGS